METDRVLIRRAVLADVPTIAAILREAFAPFEPQYTPGGLAATTPTAEVIASRLNEGPIWVAELNRITVGTVAAMLKGPALYVRSMAVLPSARGHGLGRLLLEEVEAFAQANHSAWMYLSTTPFLHSAIRLYENFGFRKVEDGPPELFGTPLFTMKKFLELTDGTKTSG